MKFNFISLLLFLLISFYSFSQTKSTKRGIAFGYHSEADLQAVSKGLTWWYNWHIMPDEGVKDSYEKYDMDFVPMTWNGSFDETALRAFLASHPKVKYLLGFNEPNFLDQANMKPSVVAAQWPRLEAIAKDFDLKIVGPAVNYCGSCVTENGVTYTDPYKYLDDFFAACPDCQVDYIAVHNYMCYSGALIHYMEGFKKYEKKIWLTEFACWDQPNITVEMQKGLVIGALDYLENDTMVYRYSWFTGGRNNKFPYIDIFEAEPGKLTPLGELYVNYNAYHDTTVYVPVPARIEAENYSKMSGISLEATLDFDGIANVGYINPDDWLEYNINVLKEGEYYIYLRIASNANTNLELRENEEILATVDIPNSKGWQNWKTLVKKISLREGHHKLRIYAVKGDFNINWINISERANSTPTAMAGADQSLELPNRSVELKGSGSDPDGDQLLYKWTKISGPTQFTIASPNQQNSSITGLQIGNYTFRLSVFDGFDVATDDVEIAVSDTPTGVENPKEPRYSFYPNPAGDKLFLKSPTTQEERKIKILDQTGRTIVTKVFKPGKDVLELDLTSFHSGIYMIQIISSSERITKTILKQ